MGMIGFDEVVISYVRRAEYSGILAKSPEII